MEGGQDKGLPVSGKLPEARCRFVLPGTRGKLANTTSNAASGVPAATAAGSLPAGDKGSVAVAAATPANGGGTALDFGRASVGVEVTRTVMLQNTGKSPAVFFVDAADFKMVSLELRV